MKFMKLGSKPDAFQADGNSVRYLTSELATDIVVIIGEVKFYLHKFPLLSKSSHLQKLVSKANEDNTEEVRLLDFPGGPRAFEICAKFCYGMTVTLNAYNVVAARCAAEYLGMKEEMEKGNLIFKIDVFLTSSIFRSWKDSIIVLQTTNSLLPWSEDLKVVGRCIDSIASKTSMEPSNVNWSYTYNRKLKLSDEIIDSVEALEQKFHSVPKDWWVEDVCELEIDLYKRVMFAIKAKGRMSGNVIGEALQCYALRWLPDSLTALDSADHMRQSKILVETIIWLLPSSPGVCCSCSFLLKLLKYAILVGAGDIAREELMKKISVQLDEAAVKDILVPSTSDNTTMYDLELVQNLVNRFVLHHTRNADYVEKSEKGTDDLVLGHVSWLKLGNLIDEYLAEIARDPSVPVACFVDLSQSIPVTARPIHDGLYRAIDIYLKEHPTLSKAEKRSICSLMDVKKFTTDACMHAAQNERLPLRVVVQVLFFEQVRAAASGLNPPQNISYHSSRSTTNTEDWEKTVPEDYKCLDKEMKSMKITDADCKSVRNRKSKKSSKKGGIPILLPSRSRRIFDKFWLGSKGHGEIKSSETSGSSMSPTSVQPGETKSSGSSSRNRRHSIS